MVSSSSDPKFYRLSYLRIKTGLMFDMPTSAQWEYACRAGTPGKFNDGSDSISAVGWYSGNWSEDTAISSNMTHEVGLKTSNRWGLYDMHGNVSEYVLERYYYPEADDGVTYVNPTIPAGHGYTDGYSTYRHIVRGGSFSESAANCRSAVCTAAQSGSSSRGYRLWLPAGIPHYGKPAAFK